ncbi:MAG TPA: hypothetical protein GX507_07245 [Clostridia bacterium]|nr:hypothetical protein [Clostridia bacterium]
MNAKKKGARRKMRQRALLRFSRSDLKRKQRQMERQEKLVRLFINSLVNARTSNGDKPKTNDHSQSSESILAEESLSSEHILAQESFPGTGSDDK